MLLGGTEESSGGFLVAKQHCCLEGLRNLQGGFGGKATLLFGGPEESSGGFWWQSNIDKGERGEDLLW